MKSRSTTPPLASAWTRPTAISSVLLVASVAAVVSYAHMLELAEAHGEAWRSWLIPLSVDGMLVASTLAIVTKRRGRQPAGWVPWLGLALGIAATVAANVAAARPDPIARLIAAWPPVALTVAIETLVIILREPAASSDQVNRPELRGLGAPAAPIKPVKVPTTARAKPDSLPPLPDSLVSKTEQLLPIGRRALAKELDVTEHQARELLKRAAPRNGVKVGSHA